MKKRFPILVGISIVTGIIGSLAVRRKQPPVRNYYEDYVGKWRYQKDRHHPAVIVSVTPDYQVLFQDRPEMVSIVELTPNRLVFLDKLGYHIIFEKCGDNMTFYDETEGHSYPLEFLAE